MHNSVLVCIYQHPESFPPTLNAVNLLAKHYKKITLVSNDFLKAEWAFPPNVQTKFVGPHISSPKYAKLNPIKKLYRWLRFSLQLLKEAPKHDILLLYDAYPIPSYYFGRHFLLKKPKLLWYHNHDVIEDGKDNKFSLSFIASSVEPKSFPLIDIFSLPSNERQQYFPMDRLKGKYYFLPNYPSKELYLRFKKEKTDQGPIKLIYQGTMSHGRGIEELIQLLHTRIKGRELRLHLKGFIKDAYKEELQELIDKHEVQEKVEFFGITSYQEVPKLAVQAHIGIAIFTRSDIMNSTLGTASNKIYEYAACGLPVLYYDSDHFKKHLGKYPWAIPTDLSEDSLLNAIEQIMEKYDDLSVSARKSFTSENNFESRFEKVVEHLKRS